ncbi:serine hydrolase [Burkholderia alba]|uniref:serine hydrolase n=1 Tax=Burkholderia alba TaxID=2683677 RepID=UPI002B060C29|nr:serine hydrolase [Burkholderia alba]
MIRSSRRRPLASIRYFLPFALLFWLATSVLPGAAAPAQAAGMKCGKATASHGKHCRAARKPHIKPAKQTAKKKYRHARSKQHAAAPKPAKRRATALHANAPGKKRGQAARIAGARPQLLQACGYTQASRNLLRSRVVYVVDERTGTVLTEKHANRIVPIASISKLMTSVVALDSHAPLSRRVRVTAQDRDYEKRTGSRLKVGSVLSRKDMLHITLMSSENRAAAALSRDYAGGRPAFVAAMNRKARALGMVNTHFVNATGLSPRNVSTARDLAKLVAAAHRYPTIRQYSADRSRIVYPGKGRLVYVSSNALVRAGDARITLQKTGFINEAGHCVVIRYVIHGRPVDVVLLGAPGSRDHLADAVRIRDWLSCSLT